MAETKIYGLDQIELESVDKTNLNGNVVGNGLVKAAQADAISVKLASGGTLAFAGVGGVDGLKVATDGITGTELADNAVARAHIGDNAVGADELDEAGSYAIAGLSMLGNNATPHKITGVLAGTDPNDVVTKSQLDGISSGIVWKAPVKYIGAHAGHNGWVLAVGNKVIDNVDDKIYTVTAGSGDGDEVTWDAGVMPEAEEARFVTSTDAAYVYDADGGTWIQFTGAGQITAGTGLSKNGNIINANVGDGLEVNGTDPADMIRVKLNGSSLARSSDGMSVAVDGVDNTMLKDQDSYSMIGLTLTGTITDPATVKYLKASTAGVVSGQVGVPIADTNLSAGNGITLGGTGNAVLSLDLSDTNPSLEIADGGVRAKVTTGGGIERSANGLQIAAGSITEAMLSAAVEMGFEKTRDVPIEAPNGTRKEFTFAYEVVIGSELVHLNGLLQQGVAGAGTAPVDDYEIAWNVGSSGKTHVYFAKAPKASARIQMTCRVVGEA